MIKNGFNEHPCTFTERQGGMKGGPKETSAREDKWVERESVKRGSEREKEVREEKVSFYENSFETVNRR